MFYGAAMTSHVHSYQTPALYCGPEEYIIDTNVPMQLVDVVSEFSFPENVVAEFVHKHVGTRTCQHSAHSIPNSVLHHPIRSCDFGSTQRFIFCLSHLTMTTIG